MRVAVGNGLRVADVLHGHLFDGQADALPFRGERVLHGLRVLATVGEHRDRVELAGGFTGHAAQVVADVVLRERGLLAVFRVEHFGGGRFERIVDLNVDVRAGTATVVDRDLLAFRAAAVVLVVGVLEEVDEVVARIVFDDRLPRRLRMEARVLRMTGDGAAHVADDGHLAYVQRV